MPKILIVEDDKLLLKVYKTNFGFMGYEVDTASDGEEGWQKIRQGGHDAILLDISLPKLSGIQILSLIKNEGISLKNRPVPIVMLSNVSDEKTINEAMNLGATAYLLKDKVSPQTLVEEVGKYIDKSQV